MTSELSRQWNDLRTKLEDKLKACRELHRKHGNEASSYEELEDLFDKRKFGNKVNNAIHKLHSERTLEEMSI